MSNIAEKITDSELEVMQTLWEAPDALPITEIRQTLQQRKGWEATTIKTLVQRLCKKGAVGQEKRTVFYYRALISQQEYNDWATNDLVHKLYQGSAKSLVASLVQAKGLTQDDLNELRDMFQVEDAQ
jgi:BlaI family penicillinase repressor